MPSVEQNSADLSQSLWDAHSGVGEGVGRLVSHQYGHIPLMASLPLPRLHWTQLEHWFRLVQYPCPQRQCCVHWWVGGAVGGSVGRRVGGSVGRRVSAYVGRRVTIIGGTGGGGDWHRLQLRS